MSLKDRAVKGAFWSALGDWSSQLLLLAVYVILARLLSPRDFGLIALASIYMALVQVFVESGFAQALIQREDLEPSHIDTAFWTNIGVSSTIAALTAVFAPLLGAMFGEPRLADIIVALTPVFLFNALSTTQQALLSRDFQFRSISLRLALSSLIGGVAGIAAALSGFGVWSLVLQQIVAAGVGTIVLWWASDWRPGFNVSMRCLKDLLDFAINVLGIRLLGFVNKKLDQLLIGYFLGTDPLGYYSVARRIFQVMTQLLVQPFSKVALPTFSRMQTEIQRLRNAYYRAIQLTTAVSIPAFSGVIALSPDMITIFFGEKWAVSAPILQFLCIVGILFGITFFSGPLLLSLNKGRYSLYMHILNTCGNIIAFSVSWPWGITAVAAAFAARAMIVVPIQFAIVKYIAGISLLQVFAQVRGSLLCSLVMVLAIKYVFTYPAIIEPGSIAKLALDVILGALVYFACSLLFNKDAVAEMRALALPARKSAR